MVIVYSCALTIIMCSAIIVRSRVLELAEIAYSIIARSRVLGLAEIAYSCVASSRVLGLAEIVSYVVVCLNLL